MIKVRFLRDRKTAKAGDIMLTSEKSAQELVNHGFAEVVGDEKQEPSTPFRERLKAYLRGKNEDYNDDAVKILWQRYILNKTPELYEWLKKGGGSHLAVSGNELDEDTKIRQLQQDALELLADKKTNDSTEYLVKAIEIKWRIVTIREDKGDEEMYIYRDGIYEPNAKTYIAEFVNETYGKAYGRDLLSKVVAKVAVRTYKNAKDFFDSAPIHLLPVRNGIIDLRNNSLMNFTPNIYFQTKMPVEYDPEAECPHVQKFYYDVLRDPQDVSVIQEFYGFCLQRDYRYQVTFMCLGYGSNGKSKHLELIRTFLGSENCTNVTLQDLERDQYAKGNLLGKLANLAGDISKAPIEDSSDFKALTGGDQIQANRKHLTHIKFVNYAKLVFSANELPPTYDTTEGFFRRWKIMDFPHRFVRKTEYDVMSPKEQAKVKLADPDIIAKLSTPEEMSGVLNWALEGLERLNRQRDFSNSQSIKEIEMQWMRRSNSFFAYIADELVIDRSKQIKKSDLRETYAAYCEKYRLESVSDKVINITFEKRGITEKRIRVNGTSGNDGYGDREFVWHGVKYKNEKPSGELNLTISLYKETEEENDEKEVLVSTGHPGQGFSKSVSGKIVKLSNIETRDRGDQSDQSEKTDQITRFRGLFTGNYAGQVISIVSLQAKFNFVTDEWLRIMEKRGYIYEKTPGWWGVL